MDSYVDVLAYPWPFGLCLPFLSLSTCEGGGGGVGGRSTVQVPPLLIRYTPYLSGRGGARSTPSHTRLDWHIIKEPKENRHEPSDLCACASFHPRLPSEACLANRKPIGMKSLSQWAYLCLLLHHVVKCPAVPIFLIHGLPLLPLHRPRRLQHTLQGQTPERAAVGQPHQTTSQNARLPCSFFPFSNASNTFSLLFPHRCLCITMWDWLTPVAVSVRYFGVGWPPSCGPWLPPPTDAPVTHPRTSSPQQPLTCP